MQNGGFWAFSLPSPLSPSRRLLSIRRRGEEGKCLFPFLPLSLPPLPVSRGVFLRDEWVVASRPASLFGLPFSPSLSLSFYYSSKMNPTYSEPVETYTKSKEEQKPQAEWKRAGKWTMAGPLTDATRCERLCNRFCSWTLSSPARV